MCVFPSFVPFTCTCIVLEFFYCISSVMIEQGGFDFGLENSSIRYYVHAYIHVYAQCNCTFPWHGIRCEAFKSESGQLFKGIVVCPSQVSTYMYIFHSSIFLSKCRKFGKKHWGICWHKIVTCIQFRGNAFCMSAQKKKNRLSEPSHHWF